METMSLVAEDLLAKFDTLQGRWEKSYKHQIILMKVYYSAGLRKLAKNSGYHGTILKSVEQCSNFK